MLLSIDLGTTNWKAALFGADGSMAAIAHIPTPVVDDHGYPCYDPRALPSELKRLLSALPEGALRRVRAVALTGMAEAGGFVALDGRQPVSLIWPWFDRRALTVYDRLGSAPPFSGRAAVTGLPGSYKYGVFKLLAMLPGLALPPEDACFLGLVEQAALALTGELATDETLAARTFAYDIFQKAWDVPFLRALGLPPSVFPRVFPSGEPVGVTRARGFGLPDGIPVCIGGHDHVCAAYGADVLQAGGALLSMGTAQVMLCALNRPSPEELATGLSFGPSPDGKPYTCLGSIQSAGGSVNFWKRLLFPGADYGALLEEAAAAPLPTGMIYLPYLAGCGAPHLNRRARASLSGLAAETTRGEIVAAVYEGIAMETRYILSHMPPTSSLICMGGLTRHRRLLDILAAATGCKVCLPGIDEGTLYGAARMAAKRALDWSLPPLTARERIEPDAALRAAYDGLYAAQYLPAMLNQTKTGDA